MRVDPIPGMGAFVERFMARMVKGAEEYGDTSMRRSADDLLDEIQQELEDTAAWSGILWQKLQRLRDRLKDAPL